VFIVVKLSKIPNLWRKISGSENSPKFFDSLIKPVSQKIPPPPYYSAAYAKKTTNIEFGLGAAGRNVIAKQPPGGLATLKNTLFCSR
jgi:hypothetical protein